MSDLHIRSQGEGVPLLLVHGWAMNSAVMAPFAEELARDFRVLSLDLPGHGRSTAARPWTLDELADRIAERLPESVIATGWSLGGLLALRLAARHPQCVRRLTLMAASPRFVTAQDWPEAQDAGMFDQFACDLKDDPKATLLRFLLLQAQGLDRLRQTIHHIKQALELGGEASLVGLQSGLDALRSADLRIDLQRLACPVQMILGERDRLVPAAMLAHARRLNPGLEGRVIEGAAHQPFLTHPEATRDAVLAFTRKERRAA